MDFGVQNSSEQFGNAQSPQKCDRKQKRPWNVKVKSADIFLFKKVCQLRFYADLEQPLELARNSSQRLHCSRRARMYSFIIYNSSSPCTVIQRKPENAGLVGESDESTFDFISWKTDRYAS